MFHLGSVGEMERPALDGPLAIVQSPGLMIGPARCPVCRRSVLSVMIGGELLHLDPRRRIAVFSGPDTQWSLTIADERTGVVCRGRPATAEERTAIVGGIPTVPYAIGYALHSPVCREHGATGARGLSGSR